MRPETKRNMTKGIEVIRRSLEAYERYADEDTCERLSRMMTDDGSGCPRAMSTSGSANPTSDGTAWAIQMPFCELLGTDSGIRQGQLEHNVKLPRPFPAS